MDVMDEWMTWMKLMKWTKVIDEMNEKSHKLITFSSISCSIVLRAAVQQPTAVVHIGEHINLVSDAYDIDLQGVVE